MKISRRRFLESGAAGIAMLSLPGVASANTGIIKIGVIDTYSGPASIYTYGARDGFKLALSQIGYNLLGKKIEVFYRNSRYRPSIALKMAKELVLQEKVDFLIGTINSAVALTVSAYAKSVKIPFFDTTSMSSKISGADGHRYVFQMDVNTDMSGKAMALAAAKESYKRYYIIGSDYVYGHAIAKSFEKNLTELKKDVKIVGQSWFRQGEPDFGPYINAILIKKPDAVYAATGGRDMVPFLKYVNFTGLYKKTAIFDYTATDTATTEALGASMPDGIYGGSPYYFYYPKTNLNRMFVKSYKEQFKKWPIFTSSNGYITGSLLIKAIQLVGAMDKERIINAIEGMRISSPVGEVYVRSYDHQLIAPVFVGRTKKTNKYPFATAVDIVTIPGNELKIPISEVKRERGL